MFNDELIQNYIQPLLPLPTALQPSGKLKEKVKCVLFDVYGTLFISGSGDISIARQESQKAEELKNLLLKFEIQKDPGFVLENFFTAINTEHETQKTKGIDFPEVEIDAIWMRVLGKNNLEHARAFAMEFELMVNPPYPMPNLENTLSACRELNMLMGIISNAQFYTPYLFRWFLGSEPVDLGFHSNLMFFSYRLGYAKPSHYMFQLAAEKLQQMHISKEAVLYIGNDMLNDIFPARSVGFQTALFAGDARSLRLREDDPECKNLSADLVITDLKQIIDHIRRKI
ncbi:MAG: HAD family hydrolase [Proteobacteria bacterium]|nr:HAD family hydrolase [Pseudomonadota bacterium]